MIGLFFEIKTGFLEGILYLSRCELTAGYCGFNPNAVGIHSRKITVDLIG